MTAHWHAGTIDRTLVCAWLPALTVGVGGGTLSTPVQSLFSFPAKRAIGAGALFNLLISLPAAAFFSPPLWASLAGRAMRQAMWRCSAWRRYRCPRSLSRPLQSGWSARPPVTLLRRSFAFCLAAVALRMLLRS